MDEAHDVDRTRELLRSECETCGAWATFTGRTEWQDGTTYAVLRCPDEGVDFLVWSERGADLLAAYERARAGARADLGVLAVLGKRLATLTRAPEPTPADVRAVTGDLLDPLPLAAGEVRVEGGWLPVVELFWRDVARVRRADLDALFGLGQWLPRVHPGTPHQLAYAVSTPSNPSTPSKVVVFAGFDEVPAPESGARSLLLRVDLPPVQ